MLVLEIVPGVELELIELLDLLLDTLLVVVIIAERVLEVNEVVKLDTLLKDC